MQRGPRAQVKSRVPGMRVAASDMREGDRCVEEECTCDANGRRGWPLRGAG